MDAANKEVDPADEEAKGGSGEVRPRKPVAMILRIHGTRLHFAHIHRRLHGIHTCKSCAPIQSSISIQWGGQEQFPRLATGTALGLAVMDDYESARLAHGSATAPCLIEVHSVGHCLPSAQVGKMLLSSGTAQLGLLCYVPASKLDKCNASEWMRATLA